jgi:putative two-component system response regulator
MVEEFQVIDIGYEAPVLSKVLVVDDEAALQTLIFDTLDGEFRLISAFNGREGVDKALKVRPAAILMDVMMPDISGYEAIKMLGANPATRDIPIIVMTAQDFDDSTIVMIRQEPNVVSFLTKPFRPKNLREAVRDAIAKTKKS